MKIVFMEADALGRDVDLSPFYELGEVVVYGRSEPGQDAKRVRDADIIVANRVRMEEALLKDCRNLKLICLTATGVNHIDFESVERRGIRVANVRGYSTDSVAQHTFALLFYLYEKLNDYDRYVKSGGYVKGKNFYPPIACFHELAGKRWGIIGLGNIGRRVAELASAFGCQVAYYSTTGTHDDPDYCRVEKAALLRESDIISIHAPLNAITSGLIGEEELRQMKKEAILLNLARGAIVDETALAKALEEGWIAGAGLDVLVEEPMSANHPLLQIQDSTKLVITPHIGWAAVEARQRCAEEVRQNIIAFLNGQERNLCHSGIRDEKEMLGRASAELKTAEARTVPRRICRREAAEKPSKEPGTGRASAELKTAEARTVPRRICRREAAEKPSKEPGTGRASAELI